MSNRQNTNAPPKGPTAAASKGSAAAEDLRVGEDGKVALTLKVGLSGTRFSKSPGDAHRCDPAEARRLIDAEFAELDTSEAPKA